MTELAADIGPDAAIVALGGYGRREQCLWSGVDVLLLHRGVETDPLVRSVRYPLWDADLLGGGVMQQEGLLELVREKLADQLNGYATSTMLQESLGEYVVAPVFGQDAGLIGAIALAMEVAPG